MSLGAAEFVTTKKLFSWRIENCDSITEEILQKVEYKEVYTASLTGEEHENECCYYLLKSPSMTATLPHSDVKYTATLSLKFSNFPGDATILFECSPPIGKSSFEVQINDDNNVQEYEDNIIKHLNKRVKEEEEEEENEEDADADDKDVKKAPKILSIYVSVVTQKCQTFEITPFKVPKSLGIIEQLKNMWKNDSSVQCLLKCGNTEITAIKPILAAASPVFNRMFETEMKEKTENAVEIEEFKPDIVEKMIEFCENDDIKEYKNYEEDLFKIAHKYQMIRLTDFAIEKMAENLSVDNAESRLQIANLYGLKDFKKWCMGFVFRNNIEIEY